MYKVLLADDEWIILEGISKVIDWKSLGAVLIGTAQNGRDAYEIIVRDQPDIVISDIRMPGMDGLQLVSEVSRNLPRIRFILLSGFGEFEYAQKALQYGVKHYLLKPCNEKEIMRALQELIEEMKQRDCEEQFICSIKRELKTALPYAKEQFLKEFVTNKRYGKQDWEYYSKLFNIDMENRNIRLILFQLEGEFEFEHLFALKNIAEDILEPLLSTTIGEQVLTLIEDKKESGSLKHIYDIKSIFYEYYQIDVTIALSEAGDIADARLLYKDTLECLNYRFYLGEGSLITKRDILSPTQTGSTEFTFNEERIYMFIQSGNWEGANQELRDFFAKLTDTRLDIHLAKSHVIQLFVTVIRCCDTERMKNYMNNIGDLVKMDTLQAMRSFLHSVVKEIALANYRRNKNRHSSIVKKMIEIIHRNLGNPDLSLNWVANEMLYMNADYLGKLFKKETGYKFSHYVGKLRIEKALEMIQQDIKIFELAYKLGFGGNPQYFSQVFKKYVGCSPTEYRKLL